MSRKRRKAITPLDRPDNHLPMFRNWLRATYPGSFLVVFAFPEECNMVAKAIGYEVKPILNRSRSIGLYPLPYKGFISYSKILKTPAPGDRDVSPLVPIRT
ncbi:MAG: hypothetical protein GDA43_06215 [Hormoscilla sp. SP5CHS1]|nr:hypothetical protein [Hormoscilla sp. SP12CHS1]MBC6452843.1 hypothetical protein [Hormoscilla sp. SP5CHS1]MBC6471454.1 hypothetical protein [Hormoscilla sp. GM102CHS1]